MKCFSVELLPCEWSQEDHLEKTLGKAKADDEKEIRQGLKLNILIYEFLIALF